MAIQLAPAALQRIRGFLAETPQALGFRFGVQRSGCSGWGYLADLAREQRPGDTVFEQDGVRIYVCLLYTSPSPRDKRQSRMPSSA